MAERLRLLMRRPLEKYQDYKVAVRDPHLPTVGCAHYDGAKLAGHIEYAKGAMGIHFVNLTIAARRIP